MSLPKAHSTPSFESLPKGLKEKAEEVINKKFGIATKKAPKSDNYPDEYRPRIIARIVNIEDHPAYMGYKVLVECVNCRALHPIMIDPIDTMNKLNLVWCTCGYDLELRHSDIRSGLDYGPIRRSYY